MNIINPQFSFVQFASGGAPADCDYLLPLALNSDLKFQCVISTSGPTQSNNIVGHSQKLYVVKSGAIITDETTLSANTLFAQTDFFTAIETGDETVLICWSAAITGIDTFAQDTCFRLCLRVDDGTTVLYYLSNCFQKISDVKYFNTLEYYATSDNYGFIYCAGASNKVRLPFYLGGPQVKEDQTAYVYSTGARKLTKYHAGNLYEVKVDTVPEDIHNKITTALAHDFVNIESPRYTGGIRKDGDYTIGWDRPEDLTAPATTKAFATPYQVVNDNCAECVDFAPCVAPAIPSFTLGSAAEGVAYNKTITLTGSVPFTLSSLVKPAWLNITVSGSIITFSGTPGSGDAGTGITVSFAANNSCGTSNVSSTINVSCSSVAISGTPVLPDGSSHNAYTYSFAVTGTGPFTLSSIVKPAWMTIAVSGSNINFSGTPATSDEGTAITVSFTINNPCGTVDFADTIDVNPGGARFVTVTFVSGDALTDVEIANLSGIPAITITITLDRLTNNNGGQLKVNGTQAFQGNTWNVVLDGSGNGSLDVEIDGVTNSGTAILGHFTITAVSSGTIGSPSTYQISKAF